MTSEPVRSIRIWWRVAQELPAAGRWLALVLGLVVLIQPACGVGFMLAIGNVVGRVPATVRGEDAGLVSALVVVAAVYVGQQLLGGLHAVVAARLGNRFNDGIEDRVMAAVSAPHGIGHLEDPAIRDVAAEASDGLGGYRWRPQEAPAAFAALVSGLLGLVAGAAVVFHFAWWLGLLLLAAMWWALRETDAHVMRMTLDAMEEYGRGDFRRAEYEYDLALSQEAAKELRVFGFAPWVLGRVERRHRRAFRLGWRRMAAVGRWEVAALLTVTLVVGSGFLWTGFQTATGAINIGAAAVLAQALLAPVAQLQSMTQALLDVRMTSRPVHALHRLERRLGAAQASGMASATLSSRRELWHPAVAGTGPGVASPVPLALQPEGVIRLEGVRFRYPGGGAEVLRGVDLRLLPGEPLALVGLNGEGKTTLVKLLCRFYEPTAGRITFNGIDIAELDPLAWQRGIAAIFQDFARLPLSAEDNLRFGRPRADRASLAEAARQAGADTIMQALPDGWRTLLSKEFRGGSDLSGGQWQRIALARALVANGVGLGETRLSDGDGAPVQSRARLLILDEPGANLDVRAEADLNERFWEMTRGTASLVISHRFSTVRRAGRVAVLEQGRIVELGSHDELVAAGGRYAELFRLQAERFR